MVAFVPVPAPAISVAQVSTRHSHRKKSSSSATLGGVLHIPYVGLQALQAACLAAAAKGQQNPCESCCALSSCFFQGTCPSVHVRQPAPTDNLCASSQRLCQGSRALTMPLLADNSKCSGMSADARYLLRVCQPLLGCMQKTRARLTDCVAKEEADMS